MRNFLSSAFRLFEILSLLLFLLHSLTSACKTHQDCRMSTECQIKSEANSSATLISGFKYILLRNKCSLVNCYDGPDGQKDLCQHFTENYTFVESQPLSIITECLCSLPQNQIDSYREYTPNTGLILSNQAAIEKSSSQHTFMWLPIRQGKGTVRFGMRPLESHVSSFLIYVGPFTFRVSDEDISIGEDKGEFRKISHTKPLRKLLHFNASESHLWISLHATWEDLDFGQTYFIKVFIYFLLFSVLYVYFAKTFGLGWVFEFCHQIK